MIEFLKKRIKSLFSGRGKQVEAVESPIRANHHYKHKHIEEKQKQKSHPRQFEKPPVSSIRNIKAGQNIKQKPPTFDIKPKRVQQKPEKLEDIPQEEGRTRFIELPIHQDILFGIQNLEFKYCTPIQAKTLPLLLAGKDLTGKAQTGTGKTAAFLIAAFTQLLNNPHRERLPGTCRVLVMAPTRELAIQIHKDAEALSVFAGMNNLVVFGGMDHHKQRDLLGKPIDILIGTPGRIIDYSRSSHLNLSKTEILIIDEADRMLDMGFIPDVSRIVRQLPPAGKRQTMFFSATLEPNILRLVDNWLKDPVTVESESQQLITDLIEQVFYTVSRDEKFALLMWLIKNEPFERMLIFGNRKDSNFNLAKKLVRNHIKCCMLSGDVPQVKRMRILEDFRAGREKILIATDVAARGIHVDDVSIVVNYDIPERAEDYVHRIGRTGRAGQKGKSIGFVCEYGAYSLEEIEKLTGQQIKCTNPGDEMFNFKDAGRGA